MLLFGRLRKEAKIGGQRVTNRFVVPSQEQVVALVANFEGQEEEETLRDRQRGIAEEPPECVLLSQNTLYRRSPLKICEVVGLVGGGRTNRERDTEWYWGYRQSPVS